MNNAKSPLAPEVHAHYDAGREPMRLLRGTGQLELRRTQEIVQRFLPAPPRVVLDVGGGSGPYALWLAKLGYEVHLIDAMPSLVEYARRASAEQASHPLASANVGDARRLERADSSVDAVLLLGPLYHLTERADRVLALREARRVLREGGLLFAAVISRFASALDGMRGGMIADPEFVRILQRDLVDGQHRNPTNHPAYFTTSFFHRPEELRAEVAEAGFRIETLVGVEGPGWFLASFEEHWRDEPSRERFLSVLRAIESEPALLGVSAHLLTIARK